MANLIDILFGCAHKRTTFPMTTVRGHRPAAAQMTGTYIVCLDCGREFAYDWQRMKVLSHAQDTANAARTAPQIA